MKDYYQILEVDKNVSDEDIKKAYKKLARTYHPDLNKSPDAEAKFKEVNEAYQNLGDPQSRQNYDMGGSNNNPFGRSDGFPFGGMGVDIHDIMRDFGFDMGGRSQKNNYRYNMPINVSFKEAVFGCEKEISVPSHKKCGDCSGDGGQTTICGDCKGTGGTTRNLGTMMFNSQCFKCQGKGKVILSACGKCKGAGNVKLNKKLKVVIPPSIETGSVMRINGGSEELAQINLVLSVAADPNITRSGTTLYSTKKISCLDALVGGIIKAELIDGEIDLEIPAGIQHGHELRVQQRGGKINDKTRGDHIFTINLFVPTINDNNKELIKKIIQESKV